MHVDLIGVDATGVEHPLLRTHADTLYVEQGPTGTMLRARGAGLHCIVAFRANFSYATWSYLGPYSDKSYCNYNDIFLRPCRDCDGTNVGRHHGTCQAAI